MNILMRGYSKIIQAQAKIKVFLKVIDTLASVTSTKVQKINCANADFNEFTHLNPSSRNDQLGREYIVA